MGKFIAGDTIIDRFGNMATVADTMESVSVEWHGLDNVMGCYPAELFELVPRQFKEGQYVRITAEDETKGLTGYIFEDDGSDEYSDPYWVMLFNEEGDEVPYSANEMIPWRPLVGERVIEKPTAETDFAEDDEGGVVIGYNATDGSVDDVSVRVLWDSFPHAQNWFVAELEPEDDYEDEITVGDVVEYESPFLIDTHEATVLNVDGNVISVAFQSGPFHDGAYSKELFSKKVA